MLMRRHLHLDGSSTRFNEAGKLKTPLRHIWRWEHLVPAAYLAAATIPAYAQSPRQAFAVAAAGVIGMAGSGLYYAFINKIGVARSFSPYLEKCFDRKPDRRTPPTSPNNIIRAHTTRNLGLTMGALWLMNIPLYNHADALGGNPGLFNLAMLTFVIGNLAREASRALYFNNVVSGRWAILDNPPPKEKKAEQASRATFAMPSPL